MAEGIKSSLYVVSAICGCFWWESSINPGIWESLIVPSDTWYHDYQYDGVGGYGLGQWTNVGGSWRARDFYEWTQANGYEPYDGNAQMKYIVEVEKVWYSTSRRIDANTLEEFLNSDSTNLEDLVWDWLANWEGVEGDRYEERLEHAYIFLDYLREHADGDKTGREWIQGNRYLSLEEQQNNALLIYWWLGGYIVDGAKKKGMPIWMMLKRRH